MSCWTLMKSSLILQRWLRIDKYISCIYISLTSIHQGNARRLKNQRLCGWVGEIKYAIYEIHHGSRTSYVFDNTRMQRRGRTFADGTLRISTDMERFLDEALPNFFSLYTDQSTAYFSIPTKPRYFALQWNH
jgi:hypothetical protein